MTNKRRRFDRKGLAGGKTTGAAIVGCRFDRAMALATVKTARDSDGSVIWLCTSLLVPPLNCNQEDRATTNARKPSLNLALQLPFHQISESMGNHDSKIVGAASVD
jgi:hypothetical protein